MTENNLLIDEEVDLLDFDESEDWTNLSIDSITYKTKTLDEWSQELSLPDLDLHLLDNVEKYNNSAIKITEKVGRHLSLTKASYYLAKAAFSHKIHTEKMNISKSIEGTNKKLPSQDNLERLALDKSTKEWRLMIKSELIYEFWLTHSYKINQINARLTSLNVLKNIESKNLIN